MQLELPPNRDCVVCKKTKSLSSFPLVNIGVGIKDTCNECSVQLLAYWKKACHDLPVFVTDDKEWDFITAELSGWSDSNHLVYQVKMNHQKSIGGFHSYFNWIDFQEFLQGEGWEFYSASDIGKDIVEYCVFRRPRG